MAESYPFPIQNSNIYTEKSFFPILLFRIDFFLLKRFIFKSTWRPQERFFITSLLFRQWPNLTFFPYKIQTFILKIGVFNFAINLSERRYRFFLLKRFIFGSTWNPRERFFIIRLLFRQWPNLTFFPYQIRTFILKNRFFNFVKNFSERRNRFFA